MPDLTMACDHGDCGCLVARCCLTCPLPVCKHDDMQAFREWKGPAMRRSRSTVRPRLYAHSCNDCQGTWESNGYPLRCAKCGSYYWHKPRPQEQNVKH